MKKYILAGLVVMAMGLTVWACCGPSCQYPVINSVTVNTDTLWPPNHKLVEVTVTADVSWVGAPEPGTVKIVSISSDEPENGIGDGDTAPDYKFTGNPGDLTVELRAERAGSGDGRTYTIEVEARQPPPCEAYARTAAVTVKVPHDKGP